MRNNGADVGQTALELQKLYQNVLTLLLATLITLRDITEHSFSFPWKMADRTPPI